MLFDIPLSPSFIQKGPCLFILYFLGLFIDCLSLLYLPLLTYILLCSYHLVFFKYFHIVDHDLSLSSAEKLGIIFIVLSSILSGTLGGIQKNIEVIAIDSFFFIYGLSSICILLALRRLGFYGKKVTLEASLPANISVFLVGSLKISMLIGIKYIGEDWKNALYPFLLLGFILISMSSSFLRALKKQHDIVLLYGAYQMWVLVFGLVAGFGFVFYGTSYNVLEISSCVMSFFIGEIGVVLITYQRMEFLKMKSEDKNVVLPPQSSAMDQDMNDDPQNLELNIYDDNLMDAEIIDEDLLIKTIRNIN
ncbi:hypothetical protein SteCoe_33454 [Stentor coeruleus]|uniref:Uncharacterized protein n=1 Tax=Stentor coeruleus TaxID=5963 RepID=A0A1R2AWR2_9CILI|nr:hypothetical protein SteCoe_33454 [Stentor coeruleus]